MLLIGGSIVTKILTKNQQEMIGRTFITPKETVLTVVGISSGKKPNSNYWDQKFLIKCSLCSLDLEMNPTLFRITKSNLIKGVIPCQCAYNPRLTIRQTAIDMQRVCNDTFEDKYRVVSCERSSNKGGNTSFILECLICSKDKCLFPEGSITSTKGNITQG